MLVRIEVMPWLSELVSGSVSRKAEIQVEVPEGASLRAALEAMVGSHPRLVEMILDRNRGQLTGHAEIVVNGALYDRVGGLDAPLRDGDTVGLLPGIAGG